jgi:hypothetical protein
MNTTNSKEKDMNLTTATHGFSAQPGNGTAWD